MNLPFFTRKKYTDPLSVLQAQTVGITSAWHHGDISDDEIVVAIGTELEKAQQSIREAIERAKPEKHTCVIDIFGPGGCEGGDEHYLTNKGRNKGIEEYSANLLRELGIEPDKPKP